MKTIRAAVWVLALTFASAVAATAQEPRPRPAGDRAGPSILQRYHNLLRQAQERGADTRAAEALAAQSADAIRNGERNQADRLMRAAIEQLQSAGLVEQPAATERRERTAAAAGSQPVLLLAFTHHYNGPGGYYPAAAEVRAMGDFFVKNGIPGTLFFDGILVERLQREDPALISQIRQWNLPLGYHGEETHGPYPVASELLGEVYTLREAQGYQGPWSLTTGKDWNAAVQLVEERYSHARPYRLDPATRRIERRQPAATDRSRVGGLKLVQQAFGKDVAMMTSHALESAPEGYAFRRMSRFGFDQPAVPIALHALKIFRIDTVADQLMRIAGDNESLFWYMGRLNSKGDDTGETHYRPGQLRHKLETLDRSRPRLLLMGFSQVDEEAARRTAQYLKEEFFPANPGSGWVTGDTLADHFEPEKAYRPTAADQAALAGAVTAHWQGRPPDLLTVGDRVYSLADAFETLARALALRNAAGALPAAVELHALYGPVATNGAARLRRDAALPAAAIQQAARAMVEALDRTAGDRFIPAVVTVHNGGAAIELNAGELLYAMAAALRAEPGAAVRIPPSGLFPPYADLLLAVFKPKALQPVCYTQGQLWTVKPARLRSAAASSAAAASGAWPKAIRVVFAANLDNTGGCHRDEPSGADLYSVDYSLETRQASNLKRLTSRPGPDWFPALAPGGRIAVYDRTTPPEAGAPARHDLWQVDVVRGREQLLVKNARFPAFDAGAKHLYYSSSLRGEHRLLRAEIQTASDGWLRLGQPQLLADQRAGRDLVEDPAPLPDGSAVVFHRKDGPQGAGLALLPIGGETVQALTPFDGSGHAAVSPDSQAIACTRSRDGSLVLLRRAAGAWQPPQMLPISTAARDYQADEARFGSVPEARHSYVEWITPRLLLVTTHGADGPRTFRFARLYLQGLAGDEAAPTRWDLSAAIEKMAGQRGRDFCSAAAVPLP